MEDYSIYFKVLGVKPGAKLENIKVAYRDLINVWHPDRFAHNPRLQKKATEKLKEINIAFDKLKEFYERGGSFDGGRSHQAPPKEEPKEKPSESPKEPPKEPPPPPPPGKDNINEGKQKKSNFFKAILLIGAWFLGAYIWVQIKNSKRQPPPSPPATVQNAPSTEPKTGIYSSEDLKRFSEETSKKQGANQPTETRTTIFSLE